jgi:hypothetical protein
MDIVFQDTWRMDWGLGNPNKTAALIGMLMVAVWWLPLWKRSCFWLALGIFTGLGLCMTHTFSRGGLLAVIVGIVPVAVLAVRPLSLLRMLGIGMSVLAIIVFGLSIKADQRLVQGLKEKDPSISNRLLIWKTAPRMMVDAPEGWGAGNSGNAYMQWYQPVDRMEGYRTLVNSHLTWMVEFGWAMRFLYVTGWLLALLLVWPQGRDPVLAVSFGVLTTFGLAATFSSVGETPILWAVPLLAVLIGILQRVKLRRWPPPRYWMGVPGLGGAALVSIFVLGKTSVDLWIRKNGEVVYVGDDLKYWVIVNKAIMGNNYGKAWRHQTSKKRLPGAAFVYSAGDIDPAENDVVVLGGEVPLLEKASVRELLTSGRRLIFINPAMRPEEDGDLTHLTVLQGVFAQGVMSDLWKRREVNFTLIPGAADYIPSWPQWVEMAQKP